MTDKVSLAPKRESSYCPHMNRWEDRCTDCEIVFCFERLQAAQKDIAHTLKLLDIAIRDNQAERKK